MPFFLGLKAKLIAGAAVALAVAVFIASLFRAGKKAGRNEVVNDINQSTNQIREKWDAIDNSRPDGDAAIDELRQRARRR